MTKENIKAGLETIRAIADAIRELKEVPAGTLYATVMSFLDLQQFNRIVEILKGAGLVEETQAHLLRWIEPKA